MSTWRRRYHGEHEQTLWYTSNMKLADTSALSAAMRGPVLTAADASYDTVRKVWNGMIDRRPAVIARCTGAADVIAALGFARDAGLPIAVRGGGHSFPGYSVCDGGVLIDLQLMKGIRVEPAARRARAESGVLWAEYDRETQAFGLASTGGMISHTGIAGLTLGGGFGVLCRKFGLAIDNLISADIVTADGKLRTVSATQEPDLFWAIRGGGGNFGIVTSFEYRLHEVGPMLAGIIAYPLPQARQVLRGMHEVMSNAPDGLMITGAFLTTPDGHKAVAVVPCYAGDIAEGERVIAPLKKLGTIAMEKVGPMPYTVVQTLFDESAVPGRRFYMRSNFLESLTEPLIDTLASSFAATPSPLNAIVIPTVGGAVRRVAPDATAYYHREAQYVMSLANCWLEPSEDQANIDWVRTTWSALTPHLPKRVYVNELDEEGADRVRDAYGPAYTRLAALKRQYDPDNVFRLNQNIPPA
jgi:FAD/FMN-containing dehydrogenase